MKTVYLALLRGVNVGGKNKLPMKDFRELLAGLGFDDVKTYIQSGNAVFTADENDRTILAEKIEKAVFERFGLKVPIVLRTLKEVERVVAENPYFKAGVEESKLHVMFLKDLPTGEQTASLDPNRSPGHFYTVVDGEVYLHIPDNLADTKLTNAYFDSRLKTIGTGRNWRTVLTLLGMLKS